MAIKGSLKEASLPDVVQLLYMGRRTGCLALADRQNFGAIYFDEGKIIYATIVNRRDRIGDLLVRSRRITPQQLQEAIERQSGDWERKLGEILVELGAITRAELEQHMRTQIEEAVYFLFTWSQGTFNFDAGVRPEEQDFLVRINPEFLLLEGARRVDEWSLIEKKIPSFDLVFAVDRMRVDESAPELTESQQLLLPLLDGTRDARQLVDESGLGDFETGKALYGLLVAGYVHRTGTSTATATPRMRDNRVDEHRNLGVAFYKAGMFDEAEREFRRVADLRPNDADAPFFAALIAARQQRWPDAAEGFTRSLDTGTVRAAALHNLAVALEQVGRLDAADAAFAKAASLSPEDGRILLGWSIVAVKRGEYAAAQARLVEAAARFTGQAPSLWHWATTLAFVGLDDRGRALAAARAGTAAYPAHPVLQNNLAVLLELGDDVAGAEALLRAAVVEDPSLPQISKNLADILYRNGRYDEAAETYERAVKLDPDLGDDLYFKLGNIAYKRRDHDRARAHWTRATSLNPDHQLARANLDMLDLPR